VSDSIVYNTFTDVIHAEFFCGGDLCVTLSPRITSPRIRVWVWVLVLVGLLDAAEVGEEVGGK